MKFSRNWQPLSFIAALICAFVGTINTYAQAPTTNTPDQLTADDVVFKREFTLGAKLHSNGFGINANFVKIHNIFKKTVYEIEIMDIHHPKEKRQQSPFASTQGIIRGFVFGKQNSFYAINATAGRVRTVSEKARRSGIGIGMYYAGGFSLGLQKPYYLSVIKGIAPNNTLIKENIAYSPENESLFLNPNLIYSAAGFRYGWGDTKIFPGIQTKVAINFDWASYHEFVKALEVGAMVNAYMPDLGGVFEGKPQGIQLMVNEKPNYFFTNLYLRIMLGKRW